jgi:hypothetical protein
MVVVLLSSCLSELTSVQLQFSLICVVQACPALHSHMHLAIAHYMLAIADPITTRISYCVSSQFPRCVVVNYEGFS